MVVVGNCRLPLSSQSWRKSRIAVTVVTEASAAVTEVTEDSEEEEEEVSKVMGVVLGAVVVVSGEMVAEDKSAASVMPSITKCETDSDSPELAFSLPVYSG